MLKHIKPTRYIMKFVLQEIRKLTTRYIVHQITLSNSRIMIFFHIEKQMNMFEQSDARSNTIFHVRWLLSIFSLKDVIKIAPQL